MQASPTTSTSRRGRSIRLRPCGFTLAEGLLASVVLAVAVIAIATALHASHQNSAAVQQHGAAVALAGQFMEEISARPFDPPEGTIAGGWKAGQQDRSAYVCIADYDGYTGHDATGRYRVSVEVEHRSQPGGGADALGDFALVRVEVRSGNAVVFELAQLFTRHALGR